MTIGILPDDVLLEIFDFYRSNRDYFLRPPSRWEWHVLVHVCQRWRHIVFSSPHRLNLQILCTYGRLVRKGLGIWPTFPIVLDFYTLIRPTNVDEDGIITALEHPDRVSSVRLYVTGSQLEKMVTVMQRPFPVLTRLYVSLRDINAPVFPAKFLGVSAPSLQELLLSSIPYPALPALLLSTSKLVILHLRRIPPTGYISPETMVACLSTLPSLESLAIEFQSATPRPDRIRPPPVTRTILPALTYFHFQGASEYLEDFVSQIDSAQPNRVFIIYLNHDDFQVAQLSKFIDRSVGPGLTPSRRAHVSFQSNQVAFTLYRHANNPGWDRHFVGATISCKSIDWQAPHMAHVLSRFSATLSTVIHLELDVREDEGFQLEGTGDVEWLHLLRQFPAMQILHVSRHFAGLVALALEDATGEVVGEALPYLDLVYLEGQPASSIEKFVAARLLFDRPVTVVDTREEFDKRLESYVS